MMGLRFLSFIAAALLAPAVVAVAEDTREEVRYLDEGQTPGKAKIADLAWLAGSWAGKGLGGTIEEVYSKPHGLAMMGMFRLVKPDGVGFYEFTLFEETGETVVYRVKHFNPDLTGWEEKDEAMTFRLVEVTGDAAYFHGLTFRRTGADSIRVLLAMGKGRVEKIDYRRNPLP